MSHAASSRRQFLSTAAAAGVAFAAPALRRACADTPRSGKLQFGVIADIHQDVMHDGVERVTAFVDDMTAKKADFVLNLGDFCVPHARNDKFLAAWNKFDGPRYHVLGNHDTDGGYKREQAVEFYSMPKRYYSFDRHGVHFTVLDGNDPNGMRGYPAFVADDQLAWLKDDLTATKLPTIVGIHQPFDVYDKSLTNAAAVRKVLEQANTDAGLNKVLAVFSGHCHLDYVRETAGIHYVQVNSASYVWTDKQHATYDAALVAKHPYLANVCPYAEPLWGLVTVDFDRGEIRLAGRESKWVGGDPWEIGLAEDAYQRSRELCRPAISGRMLPIGG